MLAVGQRVTRDDWFEFLQPFWKALLQNPLPRPPRARDHDQRSIAALMRGLYETQQGRASRFLGMAVQVQRRIDLELAAPHAFFTATIRDGPGFEFSRMHWRERLRFFARRRITMGRPR